MVSLIVVLERSIVFKLNSVYTVDIQGSMLCVCVWLVGWLVGQLFFVVEYLATQTGGITV